MYDREAIKTKLLSIIREYNLVNAAEIDSLLDQDLINSGVIDSMAMIRMQALVEHDFGVTIPEELMVGHLRTINDFIDFIVKNQQ